MRVTGNNSSVQDKIMSIRLLLDGHNFSQASQQLHFADFGQAGDVVISFDTAKTVLVPAYLCEAGVEGPYLQFSGVAPKAGEKVVCSEKCDDMVAIMAVDEAIVGLVEEQTSGRKIHYTSPLLEIAHGEKRNVNVFLTTQNAYIAVWDKGLRYAEVLPDPTFDSLLYYFRVLGEEFRLRKFDIKIGGEKAREAVDVVAEYFKNVRQV
jgi:hypothetical protein